MGVKLENIRQGLRTFDTTFFQAPGRMNVFDEHPFKVLLDYGHNAARGRRRWPISAQRLDVSGRRIVVLAGPGDRRDEDISRHRAHRWPGRSITISAAATTSLRGRGRDEVPRMLATRCVPKGCRPKRSIYPRRGRGHRGGAPRRPAGDLLLVFGDNVVRSWEQIVSFRPEDAERRSARRPRHRPAAGPVPPQDRPHEYVRDVRGVRFARDSEGED